MADYNKHWLRKWLKGEPHITLLQEGRPYLLRWYVIPRNSRFNIYLHKFLKSDEDEALHDHPWWFASLILNGEYVEHRKDATTHRKAGSVALRRSKTAHRVELLQEVTSSDAGWTMYREAPVWTLFFTGPKRREWGFHCPKGWIPWTKFTAGQFGEQRVGCGEYA